MDDFNLEIEKELKNIPKFNFTEGPWHDFLRDQDRKKIKLDLNTVINLNVTKIIDRDLIWRSKNEKNAIIAISGPTGTFKSGVGIGFMLKLHRIYNYCLKSNLKFNPLDIIGSDYEFIKRVVDMKISPPGWTIVRDETDSQRAGEGKMVNREAVIECHKTLRKQQKNFIDLSPVFLTQNVITAHFVFETYGNNYFKEENDKMIQLNDNLLKKENKRILYTRLIAYDNDFKMRGCYYMPTFFENEFRLYNNSKKEDVLKDALLFGASASKALIDIIKMFNDNEMVEFLGFKVKSYDFWRQIQHKPSSFKEKFLSEICPSLISIRSKKEAVRDLDAYLALKEEMNNNMEVKSKKNTSAYLNYSNKL